ncbi:conserved hypothetical protein [Lebetimonas natsushimae]|uniref:Uncharacterized protein n=1 Tax=Lebetimonas natsushimae TaxID=1936991 RepID=A0A292YCL2_9BACT|nr:hypothetical protein [Lebetimonas natsushimae]GAX87219.1 conserved hypothetical protein [Lebetimonas natsushimae]
MKLKVDCDSPLLQYTLEYFLKDYLNENGIIITDNPEKNGIIIGKDIKKPFTKTSLLLQLEKILNIKNVKTESFDEKLDFLLEDFKNKLIKLIKEHYGKE